MTMIQTRQREVILGVLHDAGRPLTRAEILKYGRQQINRLGSVDRAIREMRGDFCIIGVVPGQPKRYDYLLSRSIRTLFAEYVSKFSTYRLRWVRQISKRLKVSRLAAVR